MSRRFVSTCVDYIPAKGAKDFKHAKITIKICHTYLLLKNLGVLPSLAPLAGRSYDKCRNESKSPEY